MTDARGHGASDGRINELGWHGPGDITAAIDYLAIKATSLKGSASSGLSMGGEEALNAAAEDGRIQAVVAEGAGTSNYKDSVAAGENVVGRLVNWTQFALTELLSDARQPEGIEAAMPRIGPRPVLLITGDESIEKTMGQIYAAAGGSTTELWSLPDTPHTRGLFVHPTAYKERVLELFKSELLSTTTSEHRHVAGEGRYL